MMDDFEKVLAAIAAGRKDDAVARVIASLYHNGQWSKSYRLSSSGYISDPNATADTWAEDVHDIWREMFSTATPEDVPVAQWMSEYLMFRHFIARNVGAVKGWSNLWL